MPRARNIKPGFFTNDLLAEIHPYGRLLFAGLWTLADREGRLEDRARKIGAMVFPYDRCDIDALLSELAKRGFILRYQRDGISLLQIVKWHEHQSPHIKEPPSTLPAPDEPGTDSMRKPSSPGKAASQNRASTRRAPGKDKIGPVSAHALPGTGYGEKQVQNQTGQVPTHYLHEGSIVPGPGRHKPKPAPAPDHPDTGIGVEPDRHVIGPVPAPTSPGGKPVSEPDRNHASFTAAYAPSSVGTGLTPSQPKPSSVQERLPDVSSTLPPPTGNQTGHGEVIPFSGAGMEPDPVRHDENLETDRVSQGASTGLAPDQRHGKPVQDSAEHDTSTLGDQDGHQADPMPAPVSSGAQPSPEGSPSQATLVPTKTEPDAGTMQDQSQHQPSPPDSPSLIPDSPIRIPESKAAERPGKRGLCKIPSQSSTQASDSDIQTRSKSRDSDITSLREIAQRVIETFTPSETAGFIMAHFPMQQLGPRQKPLKGDTGLTMDQVNCLVRHGANVDTARKALVHFKQKEVPQKMGAWAFHCLKEELSQDAQIALREETRSAQRQFRERKIAKAPESAEAKAPSEPPSQDPQPVIEGAQDALEPGKSTVSEA